MSAWRTFAKIAAAAAGAATAQAVLTRTRDSKRAAELDRTNFHGRTVSLAAGPALAIGASLAAAAGATAEGEPGVASAALVAGLSCGAVGLYDDIAGARPDQRGTKGFRGHLGALREGRVTSGLVKIGGVGLASLAAAALIPAERPKRGKIRRAAARARAKGVEPRPLKRPGPIGRTTDVILGAGVIAGTANLVNLLDLRPGRALKAGLIAGVGMVAAGAGGDVTGPMGAAAAMLPADLDEQVMLGDAGANAYGALLGVALAARTGRMGRAGLLAALVALTATSEKVSFTKVIESTPGLRELDRLGRRADGPADASEGCEPTGSA